MGMGLFPKNIKPRKGLNAHIKAMKDYLLSHKCDE